MHSVLERTFTPDEKSTWKKILSIHEKQRMNQTIDIFNDGVEKLNISPNFIPQLWEVNDILQSLTGFKGEYVTGLEDGNSFYKMLSERVFPIGNFVRSDTDLNYTPAPDMVHDLYGHIPFFANSDYADFCQKFGEHACQVMDNPKKLRMYERFFWFTIEFGLINTPKGKRIFGAGIASSVGECEYALSQKPIVHPFDIEHIINHEFRIDKMQNELFILHSESQLYNSLDELKERISSK